MDDNKKRLENTLDFYNEKMTKKAVGRLFQEYIEEGEENYFYPDYDENEAGVKDNLKNEKGLEEAYSAPNDNHFFESYDGYDENEYYEDEMTEEEYYANAYSDKTYDDEYEEYMNDDDVDVDYNKNYSYDTVKLYSPRRKRTTKSRAVRKDKVRNEKTDLSSSKKKTATKKAKREEPIEEYYEEKNSNSLVAFILGFCCVALLVAVIVLCFKLSTANTELKHLSNRIDALENENKAYGNDIEVVTEMTTEAITVVATEKTIAEENTTVATTEASQEPTTEGNASEDNSNGNSTIPSTYTVVKGDNAWKISKKIYGTGDYYLKILEENNLDENSALVVGQEIKLPEI